MKEFCKSLLLSILISLGLIVILSVLMSKTSIPDTMLEPMVIGIASFSLLIGAFCMSKSKKEKGIVFGSLLGITYVLILYLLSSFVTLNFSISMQTVLFMVLGIVGGAIGGIMGVNF